MLRSIRHKTWSRHTFPTCHLTIGAEPDQIGATLAGLVLPAPTLEYLSLGSYEYGERTPDVFIADTLFDGTAPRNGPQDTRPLQSMLIRGGEMRVDILVWTVPNIDLVM